MKQAAREWHRALAQLLSDLGFERCKSDPALYVSKVGRCFIFLWVDDLLIFSAEDQLQPLVVKWQYEEFLWHGCEDVWKLFFVAIQET